MFLSAAFVTDLRKGGEGEGIVRAVLTMAGSPGMLVTAEGVETREQAPPLTAMDCNRLQGFYFSRPVPADGIPALLMRRWMLADTSVELGERRLIA